MKPLPRRRVFLSFSRDRIVNPLFNELLKNKKSNQTNRTRPGWKWSITAEPLKPAAVLSFSGVFLLIIVEKAKKIKKVDLRRDVPEQIANE